MKTYTIKSKKGRKDIQFIASDLIPVKQKRSFSFQELKKLIDYTYYDKSSESFEDDYKVLYKNKQNKSADFFRIKGTRLIVIPGNWVYPTTLTQKQILKMINKR
jgi:hypothetical protein